ncbi:hypothetical protein GCM10023311_14180 [Flaviramulus aquimarinus]|uniref:Uncharacterized protein n=1 Tax=Flaviramulus aquimarinus TaxID=1170456 RepID=A0ABP9F0U4_9FLAO
MTSFVNLVFGILKTNVQEKNSNNGAIMLVEIAKPKTLPESPSIKLNIAPVTAKLKYAIIKETKEANTLNNTPNKGLYLCPPQFISPIIRPKDNVEYSNDILVI